VLDALRKRGNSVVVQAFYIIIVAVFIFWGVGTMRANRMEVAARVNGEVITRGEFERAHQNLVAMYRNMNMGQGSTPPDAFLRQQAIAQLISNELLLQEAERLGFEVDEAELRQSIASMPNFQVDGRFDKEAYIEVLRQNGLKPADFEELQRRQLLAGKVEELVAQGAHVSEEEVKERFRYDNERVDLQFVRLSATSFAPQVALADQDVQAYYDANQERYREPERVRVQLLEFRPNDFAARVTPTDAEVQQYYEANLAQYQKPEEVHARHILFPVAPEASDADKATARQQADAVLAKATGGADFAALAREFSKDSTAANGGDLGRFGRGVMTPPFEAAAFALGPGQVSGIVETQFGLHIIKLEEKFPARTEPVEAVKASILDALRNKASRQVALDEVEKAHEAALDGTPLEKIAADLGLTLQAPPPFAATEKILGLERRPLADEAFKTDVGEIGEVVTEPGGYTILKVVERIPSAIPPLDQVRARVETDLRAKKAADLARQRGEALLAQLKENKDLPALARQEGLTVEESKDVGRFGVYLPNLGSAPALKDVAFTLTADNPVAPAVYDVDGDAVLAVLLRRVPPDESRFDGEKAAIRERLRGQEAAAVVRTFVEQLKTRSEIEFGAGLGELPDATS
jgi:peptidyl-prolyl cis-trans isomerase D